MDKRIALIISVILGIVAVLMVKNYVSQQKRRATSGLDMMTVVVASKNLAEGDTIKNSSLALRKYPKKYVGDRGITKSNLSLILGQTLKNNVDKGRPVLWSDVNLGKASGFTSIIRPGMRAITVPVSPLTSVGNKIKPGSRVDILLSFNKGKIETTEDKSSPSETQIPDVENIQAFREYLIRKYSKSEKSKSKQMTVIFKQNMLVLGTGEDYMGSEASKKSKGYSHITMLGSVLDAQEITHAQTMGQLSFLLRNDADVEKIVITPATDETVFRSAISASVAAPQKADDKE